MSQHKVILLLGSNLGDKDSNLNHAIKALEKVDCQILNKSKLLSTEPMGFVSNNIFRNIAIEMETMLSPIQLLKVIKVIENQMGRKEDSTVSGEYKDRIIDIDIVTFDDLSYKSKKLEIPHKKNLYERDFSITLIKELDYKT